MDIIHNRPSLRDIGIAAAGVVLVFGLKPDSASAIGQTALGSRDYPQCGGTANGLTYPSNHTILVHGQYDFDNNLTTNFSTQDLGALPGQCDNGQQNHASKGLLELGSNAQIRETYPQCGGNNDEVIYDANHTVAVEQYTDELSNPSKLGYLTQDLGENPGQCGNPLSTRLIATCMGDKTWEVIDFEVPAGPWNHSQSELDAFNKAYCFGGGGGAPYSPLREYPQCGGVANGMAFPDSHTVTVQIIETGDYNGNPVIAAQDLGTLPSQCGNPAK
jgi:hypothetical protein